MTMKRFGDLGGRVFAGCLAVIVAAGAAAAAVQGPAPALQSVLDCRKITDGPDRLACFDKAVAAMEQAEASGDLVTVDREQRRTARHQAFGLALPSLAFLDRGEKPDEVNHITDKVASASQDPYGKWTLRLDTGAVWRQIDDNEVVRPPHAGSTVEIRRGVLGSFTIKVDGQFPFKASRVS
jgi:hypothetical protein